MPEHPVKPPPPPDSAEQVRLSFADFCRMTTMVCVAMLVLLAGVHEGRYRNGLRAIRAVTAADRARVEAAGSDDYDEKEAVLEEALKDLIDLGLSYPP